MSEPILKMWRGDIEQLRPVLVECPDGLYPAKDSDGHTIYVNTHFESERAAWEYLSREVGAGVSISKRILEEKRWEVEEAEKGLEDSRNETASLRKNILKAKQDVALDLRGAIKLPVKISSNGIMDILQAARDEFDFAPKDYHFCKNFHEDIRVDTLVEAGIEKESTYYSLARALIDETPFAYIEVVFDRETGDKIYRCTVTNQEYYSSFLKYVKNGVDEERQTIMNTSRSEIIKE